MDRGSVVMACACMFLAGLSACAGNDRGAVTGSDAELESEYTADVAELAGTEAALVALTAVAAETPEEAAKNAADNASEAYGDCVEVSSTGSQVLIEFEGCSGQWGVVALSGTLQANYQLDGVDDLFATLQVDVEANYAQISFEASVGYAAVGASQSLSVTSKGRGVGYRGAELGHTSDYVVTVADSCLSVDGKFSGSGRYDWSTVISGYQACTGACPAPGGMVTRSGPVRTVKLSFDGSGTAAWSTDNRSGSLSLACGLF